MTAKQKANRERFKKVVAEAKKLRKKNPKLTQGQAVKQAWAIMYKKPAKKVGSLKKKANDNHKDSKSHNVNIKVVSGWKKGKTAMIEKNEAKVKDFKNVRVRRAPKNSLLKPGTFYNFTTLSGIFDTSIINDIDSLKKEYFKLAKKYHPDAGGTTAQFQQLQNEYEKLLQKLLSGAKLTSEQINNEVELDAALRQVIDQIIVIPGINIELVGKWLWVSGDTYPVRNELKKAGLIFIKKENKPYWVYKGVESRGRGDVTLEQIKAKYGVQKFETKGQKVISGIKINKVKLTNALKRVTKALNKRPI